ncbi:hypothetical protein [Chromobacterium alticapitis]|uniref:Flagellar FliJ protein n=1 Tax=Chromobacterium alticapitis TaxID=2073169 RepID=A0A2S5DL56_9NEIS|nr:hypothetical protein [Chromobacterium alticapitis]POZ63769.1 hypothetical protein C2I19_01575 [Chromobacterium alticapitis]
MAQYRLNPLLRLRQSALQPLKQALLEADARLEDARAAWREGEAAVRACEQSLSGLSGDPALYGSAWRYARELRLRSQALAGAAAAAEQARVQAQAALQTARMELKQVEKHKERQRLAARERQQRAAYREQDDAWLQRRAQGVMA